MLLGAGAHHGGFSSILLVVVVALAHLIKPPAAALDGASLATTVRAHALRRISDTSHVDHIVRNDIWHQQLRLLLIINENNS